MIVFNYISVTLWAGISVVLAMSRVLALPGAQEALSKQLLTGLMLDKTMYPCLIVMSVGQESRP